MVRRMVGSLWPGTGVCSFPVGTVIVHIVSGLTWLRYRGSVVPDPHGLYSHHRTSCPSPQFGVPHHAVSGTVRVVATVALAQMAQTHRGSSSVGGPCGQVPCAVAHRVVDRKKNHDDLTGLPFLDSLQSYRKS